jgi:hypothetical protein
MRAMARGDNLYSFCCCRTNWRISDGSDAIKSRVAVAVGMLMNRKGVERHAPAGATEEEDEDEDADADADAEPSSAMAVSIASRRVKNTSSESQEK